MSEYYKNDPDFCWLKRKACNTQLSKLAKEDGAECALFTVVNFPGGAESTVERMVWGETDLIRKNITKNKKQVNFEQILTYTINKVRTIGQGEYRVVYVEIKDKYMVIVVSNRY